MPQDYYSLVTNQGLIKEAASNEPGGTAIDLTEMAVGDSNGTYYDPDGSETALANEVHRVNLTHVVVDENNANQLIVEAVLDETIGPFYIREVGIFDSNGDLFAIGKYPETFKPNLPAGSGKRLYIRMILGFANSPNVNLVINNDIALDPNFGTDVNNALAERLVKTNNLSDLSNISDARNNLDVYSKSESNLFRKRNYIINGNFDIWQRGDNFTNNDSYGADRWSIKNGTVSNGTWSKESFDGSQPSDLEISEYFLKVDVISSGINWGISQKIENIRCLSGKSIAVSFFIRSANSTQVNIQIQQEFGQGGSARINNIGSQNFNVGNSWSKIVHFITIPSISGMTIGADNYTELVISNPNDETGTFEISQVKLEEGSAATQFIPNHIVDELAKCQRYYEKIAVTTIATEAFEYSNSYQFKVTKRIPPTLNVIEGTLNGATLALGFSSSDVESLRQNSGSNGATDALIAIDAEL